MAEGRMLSKRISRSFKVSTLNSDTARLFFTWLIPYLDVEGRIEADPLLIKADLFPLLDHITVRVINRILRELSDAGLIILYECNGRKYLQLEQFETFQKNLRKDREAPSRIPPPSSGVTPDLLRSDAGPTPAQRKLKEVKIREAKGDTPDLPVDNSEPTTPKEPVKNQGQENPEPEEESPPFPGEEKQEGNTHGGRWTKAQSARLDQNLNNIAERWGMRYHGECYRFVQDNFNRANPDAVIRCIERLIADRLAGRSIPMPGKWLDAALNGNANHPGENGRYEAEETAREAAELKRTMPGEVATLGRVLGEIGRRAAPC